MLHLVLGRAGSGKTTYLLQRVADCVTAGKKAILLVPEQFSFESEKTLYRRLGPKGAAQVEVLSFTRLCDNVFRRYGGLAAHPLDDTGRTLLMSIALGELRDQLTVYRSQLGNTSFVQSMVAMVGDLKTAGISPDRLTDFSRQEEQGLLRDKTGELALVYSAYQALIDRGYSDPEDALTKAAAMIEPDFFAGTEVFVDAFVAFMANEYQLLNRTLSSADAVWAAFCCDSLQDREEGMGVFSTASQTASRLVRMAREQGGSVAAPVKLEGDHRFTTLALRAVERGFLQGAHPAEGAEDGSVAVLAARDPYDELAAVAADLVRLVREQGWRYGDFAIICRRLEGYQVPIERVLERYGIPYFMDTRRPAESTPLAVAVLSALEAVRSNYRTEPLLRFAKSLAMGLEPEPLARLENYCYLWDVRGRDWLEPFTNHPAGLSARFSEEDRAALEELNGLRAAVTVPLQHMETALQHPDGITFAQAVYSLLEEVEAARHLQETADRMAATAEGAAKSRVFLEEQGAVWEQLMALLDLFAQIVGDRRMSLVRLAELFTLGLSTITVGELPQTLDQVMVGMADRIRPDEPKCTYVIGAAEGEFPLTVGGGGVFSASERAKLEEAGIELAGDPQVQAAREKYYAYFALTTPSHLLRVSYPRAGLDGERKLPSVLIDQVERVLCRPAGETPFHGGEDRVQNPASAREVFAERYREDDALRATLAAYLSQAMPSSAPMEEPVPSERYQLTDPQLPRALYGRELHLSPSSVERFYQCPFLYFCYDGLHLRPRKKVEFNPMESGTVIHRVLQTLVERHGGKGLASVEEHQLRTEVETVIQDYLHEQVQDLDKLPSRFKYLYTRLVNSLVRLLRRLGEEFLQCDFEPVAFELPISANGPVAPLILETAGGVQVQVEGTVDRVDRMVKDGRRYIRVVDYKSGKKNFALSDVLGGLNMQMLLYLFSIWENGTGDLAESLPAGVLYMPAQSHFVAQDRETAPEEADAKLRSTFRMNGLLLEDEAAIEGMEHEVTGVFIPARRKKDGGWDSTVSTLASLTQMGALKERVEENLQEMADLLHRGKVSAQPVESPNYQPCAYCDFRAVCGYEEDKRMRRLPRLRTGEVLRRLCDRPEDLPNPFEESEGKEGE